MKLIKNISLFFCLFLVFSCTKSEDDSPKSLVPASVNEEPFLLESEKTEGIYQESESQEPVFINDDGDDESGPSDTKNPK